MKKSPRGFCFVFFCCLPKERKGKEKEEYIQHRRLQPCYSRGSNVSDNDYEYKYVKLQSLSPSPSPGPGPERSSIFY